MKLNATQLLLAIVAGLLTIIAVYQQRSFTHMDNMSHTMEKMSSSFTGHLIDHGRIEAKQEARNEKMDKAIYNIDLLCTYAHVKEQWVDSCK